MRVRLIWVVISTVFALLLVACGSTSVSEVTSPDTVRCVASIGSIPTVPASGGRVPLTITAARECSWAASSDSAWMQVSPTSGQGEASVTLDVAANAVANSRTATLIVNNQRFSVPQAAAPCQYSLSPSGTGVGAAGGRTSVRLSATSGCTWSASGGDTWVHLDASSGSGDTTIGIAVDQNTGSARSAQLLIAGQTFTVTQAAASAAPSPAPDPSSPAPAPAPSPAPSPTPSVCTYTLSSYTKDFGDKGGDGGFKIVTTAGCAWSVASNADWIAITSAASGSGTADVKYKVDRNLGGARMGTISAAGQVYTVTQKGD